MLFLIGGLLRVLCMTLILPFIIAQVLIIRFGRKLKNKKVLYYIGATILNIMAFILPYINERIFVSEMMIIYLVTFTELSIITFSKKLNHKKLFRLVASTLNVIPLIFLFSYHIYPLYILKFVRMYIPYIYNPYIILSIYLFAIFETQIIYICKKLNKGNLYCILGSVFNFAMFISPLLYYYYYYYSYATSSCMEGSCYAITVGLGTMFFSMSIVTIYLIAVIALGLHIRKKYK